jgi:hypothetical protein
MVVMDATTLMLLIDPTAKPPRNPATGAPVDRCKDRIEFLIATLSEAGDGGTQIIIPTPVLSEVLVRAGKAKAQYLNEFTSSYSFRIAPFDEKAAIELAFLIDADLQSGKRLSDVETKAKVKFDRQIIAIAKVQGANVIYSDDGGLKTVGEANGFIVIPTWELPTPPMKQVELGLEPPRQP